MLNSTIVSDTITSTFENMKLKADPTYMIARLNDNFSEIILESQGKEGTYENFLTILPKNECRYIIYNFNFTIPNTSEKTSKFLFYMWIPDAAPTKEKVRYSGNKKLFFDALNGGISITLSANSISEIEYNKIIETVTKFI